MINLEKIFKDWPFSVVPDRTRNIFWAGRHGLNKKVLALLESFKYRPQSTLDLIWASYGSGKTHLLYYIEQESKSNSSIIPWYCIVPEQARSFSDLYRNMFSSFPFDKIIRKISESSDLNTYKNDVERILLCLAIGTHDQRRIAKDWFIGRRIDLRKANRILYLPFKIEKEYQMMQVFTQFISILIRHDFRVLLMFDEFQRIENSSKFSELVNAVILDTFNANPRGFSTIFSCTAIQQQAALNLLSPALNDRFRGRKIFPLPEFSCDEALDFICDLLAEYRPEGYSGEIYKPFAADDLISALKHIQEKEDIKLIPRHILQVLDTSLQDALSNNVSVVDIEYLSRAIDLVALSGENND